MPGLAVEMREHQPGDQVEVSYVRDGQRLQAQVTVGERPRPGTSQE
jgi:S1-C subfamily serine protease